MPNTSNGKITQEELQWYLHFEHKRIRPTAEENRRYADIKHRLAVGCFQCEYNRKLVVAVDYQVQVSVRVRVLCDAESIKKGSTAKPSPMKVNQAPTPTDCKHLRHLLGPRTTTKALV